MKTRIKLNITGLCLSAPHLEKVLFSLLLQQPKKPLLENDLVMKDNTEQVCLISATEGIDLCSLSELTAI